MLGSEAPEGAAQVGLAASSDQTTSKTASSDKTESFERASFERAVDLARAVVLRQLTMAPRSRSQLQDTLRAKGCPDDVASAVLDRLSEVGLVDDAAFAGMLVRSKQATRGLAKRALAHELRSKGIDDELIQQSVDSINDASERARAEELVARRLRSMPGLDPQVQGRRLAAMLARKGYPSGIAYAVVRNAVASAAEHQRD